MAPIFVTRSPLSSSCSQEGFGAGALGSLSIAALFAQVDLDDLRALVPAEDGKIRHILDAGRLAVVWDSKFLTDKASCYRTNGASARLREATTCHLPNVQV